MKPILLYLPEMLFCSALFCAFYRWMLARRVSYAACRHYLVAVVLFSAVIPAFRIPLYPAPVAGLIPETFVAEPLPRATAAVSDVGETVRMVLSARAAAPLGRTGAVAAGIYLCVSSWLLAAFALRVVRIRRLRCASHLTDCGAYLLAENPRIAAPFSFLRTVFLGAGFEGRQREMVLEHEAAHVRHRHSVERIVVELALCLVWFNPFVWIIRRWLREVHEWEADRDVLDAGYDLTAYRTVIFRQLFGYNPDITSGLNHSFIKNRFVMMTRSKERRLALLRLGAAIPVMAGMMMLCSFTVRDAQTPAPETESPLRATLSLRSAGGRLEIRMNGEPVDEKELAAKIAAWREGLTETDRARAELVLRNENAVCMGDVSDVKNALRKVNQLRVFYRSADGAGVVRMLPPDPEVVSRANPEMKAVKIITLPRIAPRNLFRVRIGGSGEILAGQSGAERSLRASELPAQVRSFILNAGDDPKLPEKEMKTFDLPEGGTMSYPVSRGFVVVAAAPNASYDAYVEVQRQLSRAFDGIRLEVARQQFGQDFAALSDAERQVICKAVPMKITEDEPAAD